MRHHRWASLVILVVMLVTLVGCTSGEGGETVPDAAGDEQVVVGSFDFAESEILAEMYSQALEAGGFPVRRAFQLGPREFVAPASSRGLVDLVPEYAGTAVHFLTLGSVQPGPYEADTHRSLDGPWRTRT